MAGNPFEAGTGPVGDDAASAKIRAQFEKWEPLMPVGKPQEAEPEFDEANPDAQVKVLLDASKMAAYVFVKAPAEGGAEVTAAQLSEALKAEGVAFGLDSDALREVLLPTYGKKVKVAAGTPAKKGRNGACRELYSRQPTGETELPGCRVCGDIRDILAGMAVGELVQPTKGTPGRNVLGEVEEATDGVMPPLPTGEGVRLSADGNYLETVYAGNLVFENGAFEVQKTVRLQTPDREGGAIHFSGDIVVEGELADGCSLTAGGNVTVKGIARAAVVEAKGDILLEQGMDGGGRGILEAGKDVRAGWIDNAIVRAEGVVAVGRLSGCTVECEGGVQAIGEEGVIRGGRVVTMGPVTARQIGTPDGTETAIELGPTPRQKERLQKLEEQLAGVNRHIEEIRESENAAKARLASGEEVPQEQRDALKRAQLQLPLSERKRSQIEQGVAEEKRRMEAYKEAVLTADVIWPPTEVTIGSMRTAIEEKRENSKIYYKVATEIALD